MRRAICWFGTVILILLMPAAVPASASDYNGNELLRKCNATVTLADNAADLSADEAMQAIFCTGYLDGFLDAHQLSVDVGKGRPFFCLPKEGIQVIQAARIVTKWLKAHPEELHESGRASVAIAIAQVFPCQHAN
jgi:hypothetical protein